MPRYRDQDLIWKWNLPLLTALLGKLDGSGSRLDHHAGVCWDPWVQYLTARLCGAQLMSDNVLECPCLMWERISKANPFPWTWKRTICLASAETIHRFGIWNAQRNRANKAPRDPKLHRESSNLAPSVVGAAAWMLTSKVAAQHIWVSSIWIGPCHPWLALKRTASRLKTQNYMSMFVEKSNGLSLHTPRLPVDSKCIPWPL